jgi:hypothetical protein
VQRTVAAWSRVRPEARQVLRREALLPVLFALEDRILPVLFPLEELEDAPMEKDTPEKDVPREGRASVFHLKDAFQVRKHTCGHLST